MKNPNNHINKTNFTDYKDNKVVAAGSAASAASAAASTSKVLKISPLRKKSSTNIVLIGFMGCGKSTVARRLARLLGRECVDTDALIEKEHGQSCRELIESRGEAAFRAIESELLERLSQRQNLVIATGGGFAGLRRLRKMGFVVWLYLSFERTAQRLANDSKRPLWNDRAQELFAARLLKYERECDLKINVLAFKIAALASTIAAFVQLEGIKPARLYQERVIKKLKQRAPKGPLERQNTTR